ncbi:uncharacterized protein [Glycine max]|uniref:uncharacterized protein n=1 Tax=Glycine max TaxID=3847 RepID=UPI0003DE7819|nr:uncharacterized protein LOC102667817 [Glycine max]|eukprot:XP_006582690.1 uncharacterized protein LOC102667817 [Glycine max]
MGRVIKMIRMRFLTRLYWAARMDVHLEANDIWEADEEDYEDIFSRIITIKSTFDVWNFLKDEYEGDERIKGMQAMNLIRKFEMQKMKESETIKEYANKLLSIANQVRLLGFEFSNSRIVQKILLTAPKKFEASIASLENTKDPSKITLAELVSAMQSQELRRLMRQDSAIEGALPAKHHHVESSRKKYGRKNQPASNKNGANNQNKGKGKKKNYPPCRHYGKLGHPPYKCWKRPDAKCSMCNQLRHEAIICRSKFQQHEANAQVVEQEEEDYIFATTCYSMRSSSECWLIDSGCMNHMTYDKTLFKDLKPTNVSKVRIGNGGYISAKGKRTIAISTCSVSKAYKVYHPQTGKMIDLGLMTYFLGIEIKQSQNKVLICQRKYAKEILKKFQMEECKSISTPMNQKEKFNKEDGANKIDEGYYRSLIGCLKYLTAKRPNILFVVSLLSRFMHCASEIHLKAAKRILSYWARSVDNIKSTSGYCFSLGSGVFSWCTKKQAIVAQSTAETEFIAATTMKQNPSCSVMVDNWYGEFLESIEPSMVKQMP